MPDSALYLRMIRIANYNNLVALSIKFAYKFLCPLDQDTSGVSELESPFFYLFEKLRPTSV